MLWVIVLLFLLLIIHFYPKREGYTAYDETTCISLATQNESNIASLQQNVNTLLALQTQVQNVQNATDANANQLKTLVSQVYNTPSTT